MDNRKIMNKDVDWIHLVQARIQRWAFVNMGMNLLELLNLGISWPAEQ
jgi:hypothetical protein